MGSLPGTTPGGTVASRTFPKLPELGCSFRKNKTPKAATIFSSDVPNPYSHKEMEPGTCYPPHPTSVLYTHCLISAPRVCPAWIFVNTTSVSFPSLLFLAIPPFPWQSFPISLSLSPLQFLLFAQLPFNASYKHTGLETHTSPIYLGCIFLGRVPLVESSREDCAGLCILQT